MHYLAFNLTHFWVVAYHPGVMLGPEIKLAENHCSKYTGVRKYQAEIQQKVYEEVTKYFLTQLYDIESKNQVQLH